MSASTSFAWTSGKVLNRAALLFSDGEVALAVGDAPEDVEKLHVEWKDPVGQPDPAKRAVVRIEVLSIEDPRPPAPPDVKDLLQRVRALPRLTPSLKAEIDAVLSRTET